MTPSLPCLVDESERWLPIVVDGSTYLIPFRGGEQWRPAAEFETTHLGSNLGRVYRQPRTILIFKKNAQWEQHFEGKLLRQFFRRGYPTVKMLGQVRPVHRLAAATFKGPIPDGYFVCHNDGDKTNNRVWNLRFDTPKGNHDDMYKHGTRIMGEHHHQAKLTRDQVIEIRRLGSARMCTQPVMAKRFGVSLGTIESIIGRRTWRHVP